MGRSLMHCAPPAHVAAKPATRPAEQHGQHHWAAWLSGSMMFAMKGPARPSQHHLLLQFGGPLGLLLHLFTHPVKLGLHSEQSTASKKGLQNMVRLGVLRGQAGGGPCRGAGRAEHGAACPADRLTTN